ncbi:MAG: hypothetical protein V3V00_00510 [Saprospiraceae bacterium]
MKIKSLLLSSLFFLAITSVAFATSPTVKTSTSLAEVIKSELSKIDLDFDNLNGQSLKIRFMINEKSEIIVLSTNNKSLDKTIKNALNYDKLDTPELKPFEVYVVPITFETK